jgi:PAS domain S-box-containing protein
VYFRAENRKALFRPKQTHPVSGVDFATKNYHCISDTSHPTIAPNASEGIMSTDSAKTKKELIGTLGAARREIAELKKIDAKHEQTEKELRQNQALLNALLEGVPNQIFIKDADGRYLVTNTYLESLLGKPKEELLGLDDMAILPPETAELLTASDRRVMTSGETHVFEETRTVDGKTEFWRNTKAPYRDHTGQIVGVIGIAEEITESKHTEKALRKSEERFRLAFHTSPDSINLTRLSDGMYLDINEGFTKISGYTREEVLGSTSISLNTWKNPEDRKRLVDGLKKTGSVTNLEAQFIGKNGEVKVGLMSANILEMNDEKVILSVTRDITERKKTETDLVEAKEAAESASLAKSQFLANMSHEIRTPLNGVLGTMQLLHGTPLNDMQKELLETGLNSGRSLLQILGDILDLSRIESGKMEIREEAFSLEETVSPLQGALMNDAACKNLSVEYHLDPALPSRILGDSIRLRQILFNLVGNAIKFTMRGGVSIRAFPEETKTDSNRFDLCFEVSDTGIGIPKNKLASIFEPFTQVDGSYTREYGGTGLGLNIVGRLVNLMDGAVHVESEVGVGTTFRVRIPVKFIKDESSVKTVYSVGATPLKATQSISPLHILLAEDDLSNQLVASHLLKNQGHTVVCVSTGREAFQALEREELFDLVLMDVQMPEMDGVETTRKIRKETRFHDLPIIALTAHAMDGDKELFLEAGMDDYLSKPIEIEELEQVIARRMRKKGRI